MVGWGEGLVKGNSGTTHGERRKEGALRGADGEGAAIEQVAWPTGTIDCVDGETVTKFGGS